MQAMRARINSTLLDMSLLSAALQVLYSLYRIFNGAASMYNVGCLAVACFGLLFKYKRDQNQAQAAPAVQQQAAPAASRHLSKWDLYEHCLVE